MACDIGADKNMFGIVWINGNSANCTVFGNRHTAWYKVPGFAGVGGFVEANACFGIAGPVLLTGANIKRLACAIVWIKDDRADGVGGKAAGGRTPRGYLCKGIIRRPDATACCTNPDTAGILIAGVSNGNSRHSARVDCGSACIGYRPGK